MVTTNGQGNPHIIDEYRDYLENWLQKHPFITGKRPLQEIKERGYKGGYISVKDCIRTIHPTGTVLAIYRYETKPGEMGQVDWGECGLVEIDEEERARIALP